MYCVLRSSFGSKDKSLKIFKFVLNCAAISRLPLITTFIYSKIVKPIQWNWFILEPFMCRYSITSNYLHTLPPLSFWLFAKPGHAQNETMEFDVAMETGGVLLLRSAGPRVINFLPRKKVSTNVSAANNLSVSQKEIFSFCESVQVSERSIPCSYILFGLHCSRN